MSILARLSSARTPAIAARFLRPFGQHWLTKTTYTHTSVPRRILTSPAAQLRFTTTTAALPPRASSRDERSEQEAPRSVRLWLYGCAGAVFAIVAVGGTTRLTNSGLSMVDWSIQGSLPPITQAEWEAEFEKYKAFPEYQRLYPHMTLSEFKNIFFWEYSHRMLGRMLGVLFLAPFSYFVVKNKIPKPLIPKLLLMFAMGGGQGLLGWYMVKSGLDEKSLVTPYPTVSPYRLAAHLSSAFTIYSFILWTALSLSYKVHPMQITPALQRFRLLSGVVGGVVCTTVVSGAFVAGLDAGLYYNEFPFMGQGIIPVEWSEKSPLWRNFTENPIAVQFNHRVLGITSLCGITALFLIGHRRGATAAATDYLLTLPSRTRTILRASMGMGLLQVTLGIATLLYHVPVSLGVMHQAGSLTLLTLLIALLHSLRVPPAVIRAMLQKRI